MTKRTTTEYAPRWNEPRRVPELSPEDWVVKALCDVRWRAELSPADHPENPFLIGLVLGLARTYMTMASRTPQSSEDLEKAQLHALRRIFHKVIDAPHYWPEALQRIAHDPNRRVGIEAGRAITIAAFDATQLPNSLLAMATHWLEGQSAPWVRAVCGESPEEQIAYALRETLVVERLAPHRAMPRNDA
jgi:hypothetical protein